MDPLRDNFVKSLSNYSECIRPYLRQIQEKYVAAYYVPESGSVDLNAYCLRERQSAMEARKMLENHLASEW